MLTTEVRLRLVAKIAEASGGEDEEVTARVLTYARAALVALAGRPAESEVELRGLEVSTKTAALILGLHPEYVRSLIRRDRLQAAKRNGEFHIVLEDVVEFAVSGIRSEVSKELAWMKLEIPWLKPTKPHSHGESA